MFKWFSFRNFKILKPYKLKATIMLRNYLVQTALYPSTEFAQFCKCFI